MKITASWLLWLVTAVALTVSSVCVAQSQGGTQGSESETQQWFSVDSINVGLGVLLGHSYPLCGVHRRVQGDLLLILHFS